MQLESWAKRKSLHVAAPTEPQHAYSSAEGSSTEWTDGSTARGDYKWYFSSGVKPEDRDKADKLKRAGKHIPRESTEKIREHAGVAFMMHKKLWGCIDDVAPIKRTYHHCQVET